MSKIVPDDEMLRDSNGKVIDIIMSPLAVISRLNMSQIYVSNLGLISKTLYQRLDAFFKEGGLGSQSDGTPGKATEEQTLTYVIRKLLPDEPSITLKEVYERSKPYERVRIRVSAMDRYFTSDLITDLMKTLNINEYEKLFDPKTGRHIITPIRVGYQEFIRLHFIAEKKMKATGTMKTTGLKGYGSYKPKGQKLGEMEAEALMAHGEHDLLRKFSYEENDKNGKFYQEMISLGLLLQDNRR